MSDVAQSQVSHGHSPGYDGETRRDQIAWPNEAPVGRIIVVCEDQVVWRQRCPADISVTLVVALPPIDPSRTPVITGDPDPAELIIGAQPT